MTFKLTIIEVIHYSVLKSSRKADERSFSISQFNSLGRAHLKWVPQDKPVLVEFSKVINYNCKLTVVVRMGSNYRNLRS